MIFSLSACTVFTFYVRNAALEGPHYLGLRVRVNSSQNTTGEHGVPSSAIQSMINDHSRPLLLSRSRG